MANKFEITISAVDKATAVFRNIETQTNKLTEPYKKLGQSMSDLSRASGIGNVSKELGKIRDVAGDVASKVASILPPLAGLAGVASVAGIATMATSWGSAGAEISRTSGVIGVGTTRLQELRGAARLAGLSAEDMTGGLKSLGKTFEDSVANRNIRAAGVMRQFGITLHRTKNGAVDSARALIDVSNAMKSLGGNVQAQDEYASIFGIGNLLPLLQKGGAGINAYVQQFDKLGGVMSPAQLVQADHFNTTMIKLDLAFDRMKWTIGAALAPELDKLADWMSKLKSEDVSKGIDSITKSVRSVVDALGGWKAVGIEVAALMGAKLIGSIGMSIVKIGMMATQWKAVTAAAEAAKGAQILAAEVGGGAAAAGGAAVGGAGSVVAGAGFSLLSRLSPGLFAMFHSSDDGGAEEDWAARNRSTFKGGALASLWDRLEKQYQLPHGVLGAVRHVESADGKNLHSPKGALGPFQLMPNTAKMYGVNPMDEIQAANAAAKIIRGNLDADHGDLSVAMADWNWGAGNRKKKGLENAPAETRGFVDRVFRSMGYGGKALPSLYKGGTPQQLNAGEDAGRVVSANQPTADASSGTGGGQVDVVVEFVNAPAGMRPHIKTSGNVTATIGHSGIGLAPI